MSATGYYQAAADNLSTTAVQALAAASTSITQYLADQQTLAENTAAAQHKVATTSWSTSMDLATQNAIFQSATINESGNANAYIGQLLAAEKTRVGTQERNVKQQEYKLKNELMMYQYLGGYYRTATAVIIVTLYVTMLLLVVSALWRARRMSSLLFAAVLLVVLIAYLLGMVAVASKTAKRRDESWQQFNW